MPPSWKALLGNCCCEGASKDTPAEVQSVRRRSAFGSSEVIDVDSPLSSPRQGGASSLARVLESKVSWLESRLGAQDDDVNETLQEMRQQLAGLGGPLLPNNKGSDTSKGFTPSTTDSAFPMMVMKMQGFLDLTFMEPYDRLRASGHLEEAPRGAVVHIISHQWLGSAHPDPNGIQLRRLQHFFRTMMLPDGCDDLFTPADWASFSVGSANGAFAAARSATAKTHWKVLSEKDGNGNASSATEVGFKSVFAEDILNGYVWLDFASVPQTTIEMPEARRKQVLAEQSRAIESIPDYFRAATYFYVCAPAAPHENGSLCDFASWRNRGWCRLEEWANILSPAKTMMPIVITDQPKVFILEFLDFFLFRAARRECSVFHGQFKCCECGHVITLPGGRSIQIPCDKEELMPLVGRMYDEKLQALVGAGNDVLYRINKVMEPAVLAGSKEDRMASACSPDESIADFSQRLRLPRDPAQGDSSGMPAIQWAAFMGHTPMVCKLLKEGCSAEVADEGGLTPLMAAALCSEQDSTLRAIIESGGLSKDAINAGTKGVGMTALDRAAKGGNVAAAEYLLRQLADVDCRRHNGATPLMSASEAGHKEIVELLLVAGADVHAVDSSGQGCLHRAAHKFFPHVAERAERREACVALLQARGNPMLEDLQGRTPIQIATEQANTEFIRAKFSFGQPTMGKEKSPVTEVQGVGLVLWRA